jgi:hypothetical protein
LQLKGASLAKIRLGWESLSETNTLVYFDNS